MCEVHQPHNHHASKTQRMNRRSYLLFWVMWMCRMHIPLPTESLYRAAGLHSAHYTKTNLYCNAKMLLWPGLMWWLCVRRYIQRMGISLIRFKFNLSWGCLGWFGLVGRDEWVDSSRALVVPYTLLERDLHSSPTTLTRIVRRENDDVSYDEDDTSWFL